MSELKRIAEIELKTVGDCVRICELFGLDIKPIDDNLFEIAGVVHGFVAQLADAKAQLQAAQQRIKELEQGQEWISIDDSPIENGNYLCFVRSFGEFYQIELESYTCPEYGNQFWQTPLDGEDFEGGEVVCYMQLPQPPKGNSND